MVLKEFLLLEGGIFTNIFWIGEIIIGGLIPLALIYAPGVKNCRITLAVVSWSSSAVYPRSTPS